VVAALGCTEDNTSFTSGGGGAPATGGGGAGATGGGGSTSSGADTDDDGDGFSENQDDCNDADPNIHPDAVEICDNETDDNCNGAVDASEPDADGDGFGPCQGDCNDGDPTISPVVPEMPGDGIDNNCDGTVDADFDADGYTDVQGDCDDADPDINPGATEDCFDGLDNDCNGFADDLEPDVDMDGYGPCDGDCAEGDPTIGPGQPEIDGDGIDNNCDNLVDLDVDGDGWTVPNGDCNDNDANINPSILEVCADSIDNDCDGTIDSDCVTACDLADLLHTSVGCVYFAVDNNNDPIEGYDAQPYAVAVSNVDPVNTANVDVQVKMGNVWTTIQSGSVAPGTLFQFNLPDRHVNYTNMNVGGAYRVVSDYPIIAYQFQPINGQTSYTSDASLLLPKSALDQFYYVAGWGKPSFGNGQLVIVASEDATSITITPSVNTVAGGGIPALTAGVPYTFPMSFNAGDYVQLEASTTPNSGSFAGTYVTADKPVAVFSNNWCANVPTQVCCCDHLEEQLIGLQTWGNTYVAARHPVRNTGTPETAHWQIVASQAATTVTFSHSPGVTGVPAVPQTLNAGQYLTLAVGGTIANPGDFVVTADKPILVMQYMSSSQTTNAPANLAGDPFMTQAVPVEQFLDSYLVLVPTAWTYDYVILTKPVGATVTIDNLQVPQASFVTINDGINPPQWEVARVALADGVHTMTGSAPFGVVILGLDAYDSYAYPGGLNQQIINPMN
jgi:hypothetical protein